MLCPAPHLRDNLYPGINFTASRTGYDGVDGYSSSYFSGAVSNIQRHRASAVEDSLLQLKILVVEKTPGEEVFLRGDHGRRQDMMLFSAGFNNLFLALSCREILAL